MSVIKLFHSFLFTLSNSYRFGSFEIFKDTDPTTGRGGPSVGRTDILTTLLDYVVKTFYTEVVKHFSILSVNSANNSSVKSSIHAIPRTNF